MPRPPNLRQIEAFKAIIETGTVSEAAQVLGISQPAASKLLAHLEAASGLSLFDRSHGRLVPTAQGMRLYEEIDRIFSGMKQVERAIESIRWEERGRLSVGVMPGLAGPFLANALQRLLTRRPSVYVSVAARSSQFICDWLLSHQLDVGLVNGRIESPHLISEPLLSHSLVCVLPPDHHLADRSSVLVQDLAGERFISFAPGSITRTRTDELFEQADIAPNRVMDATTAPTVCELVAAGLGISVMHPLLVQAARGDALAIRPFLPRTDCAFLLCRLANGRNTSLVEEFAAAARGAAADISAAVFRDA